MARPFDLIPPKLIRQGPPPDEARKELILFHGAWRGIWAWQGLAGPLSSAGYGLNMLELPGHGLEESWPLPRFTSLKDYADYAARAAGALHRPVLIGHSMGGWIVQKLLEVTDLPSVLLAPLPGSGLPFKGLLHFVATHPTQAFWNLMGRSMSFEDDERELGEPWRVTMEMGLGLVRANPRKGLCPRLVVAGDQDPLIPPEALLRLADRLGAGYELLSGYSHLLWQENDPGPVAELLLDFLAELS